VKSIVNCQYNTRFSNNRPNIVKLRCKWKRPKLTL